jgi:ceramide glucosyltransferase
VTFPTAFQVAQLVVGLHLLVMLLVYVPSAIATLLRLRRHSKVTVTREDKVVTVLRPMRGLDPHLEENLLSYAALDVPEGFEVLLLLDDNQDEALPLCRRLEARFPGRFRVIIGTTPGLLNPKVALMVNGLKYARNQMIWMTDSNTETNDAHFNAQLEAWKQAQLGGRKPTLVHAPLAAVGGSGLGAVFERMQLSTYGNISAETSLVVGIDVVVGKSLLFRADDLPAVGGLEVFGQASGEDYLMGRAFHKVGAVQLANRATRQVLGEDLSWIDFWRRQTRWAVVRKRMSIGTFFLLEHFSYFGLLWVWLALGLLPWEVVAAVFGLKMLMDGLVQVAYSEQASIVDMLLVPVKDLVLLSAWVWAFFLNTVTWRGRTLTLDDEGNISGEVDKLRPSSLIDPR